MARAERLVIGSVVRKSGPGSTSQQQLASPSGTALMESMMSASIENHSPELTGLLAANSACALVEAAFIPVSRRIGPASLWFIAAICMGTLVAAAGVTMTGDAPLMAALDELPGAPEVSAPAAPVARPLLEERIVPTKNPRVLPIVLRGQPSRAGSGS
jgi:hypothetical protein